MTYALHRPAARACVAARRRPPVFAVLVALGLVGPATSRAAAQPPAPATTGGTVGADTRATGDRTDTLATGQARVAALRAQAVRLRAQARQATEEARRAREDQARRFLDQQTAVAATAGPVAAANAYSTQNANLHRGGQLRGPLGGEPATARRLRAAADSLDAEATRLSVGGRPVGAGQ